MPSKTSCFNPTLFRKNLTRFWPLWGGMSLLGALAPLAVLVELVQNDYRLQPLEMTLGYYEALHMAVPIISLIYAALCALAVWHYLYSHRSVSMYHALPITRAGLFVTNFLSGLAMMLIPYAVTGVLFIGISLGLGFFEPVGTLVTILGVVALSFFYFASATLVAFITGNPFAFAALYFIFHFLAAGAEYLVMELVERFYYGVVSSYEGVIEFLSPTLFLVRNMEASCDYVETITASGWVDHGELASVTLQGGWLLGVYTLAGLALMGFAWLLYQRRRSECAGDVVAVTWMKPIFRYGVAICAALSGGTILYSILCDPFQRKTTAAPIPMALCMVLAGLVGYYIASMLLARSLQVFRGSGKGAAATAVAAAALCALIVLDPAGVESWVPAAEDLTDASVSFYTQHGHSCTATLENSEDIQKLLDVQQAILDEKDALNYRNRGLDTDGYAHIDIHYCLPDGRTIWRNYFFDYGPADLQREGAVSALAALACDPAVQESNIFENLHAAEKRLELRNIRFTGGVIGGLYDESAAESNGSTGEREDMVDVDLTAEQARALEAAIRRDIQAGHFGKTVFATDYEAYDRSVYYPELYLNYTASREGSGYRETNYSSNISLYLSVHCTETVKALEDLGVTGPDRRLITQAEYNALFKDSESGYDDYYDAYYEDGPYESIVYHGLELPADLPG